MRAIVLPTYGYRHLDRARKTRPDRLSVEG